MNGKIVIQTAIQFTTLLILCSISYKMDFLLNPNIGTIGNVELYQLFTIGIFGYVFEKLLGLFFFKKMTSSLVFYWFSFLFIIFYVLCYFFTYDGVLFLDKISAIDLNKEYVKSIYFPFISSLLLLLISVISFHQNKN